MDGGAARPYQEAPADGIPEQQPTGPDAAPLTVGQCLATLVAGLVPFAGLVCCLVWAYGRNGRAGRRNLAKALLWLHGFVVVAAIVGLCVWVVVLAVRYGLFTSLVL